MKIFKLFCTIIGLTWIIHFLLLIFTGHELSKLSSLVACANSVILYFMFAIATYTFGGDKE